jgi:magnesium-transporting ATPase (P-type)
MFNIQSSSKLIVIIIFLSLYLAIISVWCFRFPISYNIVGGDPDLIENRDLTNEEYSRLDEAYQIRSNVSNLLLYSSIFLCIGSYLLRRHWIEHKRLLKTTMYLSGVIAVILILVQGIHFVPGPPIR